MAGGLLAAIVTAVVVVVASDSASSSTPSTPTAPSGGSMTLKQRLYAQLQSLKPHGLTEDHVLTLMLIAYGETGGTWKPTAHNDTASEVAASERAFDRIAAEMVACGLTRAQVAIGSIGRFQQLGPYYVHAMRDVVPCIDPQTAFDGVHDIIGAIANAHALTTRYKSWNGRVSGVRGGWGTLSWLDAAPDSKLEKWQRHAEAVGLGADFIDRTLTPFPAATKTMLATLQAGAAVS